MHSKLLSIAGPFVMLGSVSTLKDCSGNPIPPKIEAKIAPASVEKGDRFLVKKMASFSDDDAYRGTRTIYLITDRETGAEYFGVSGVGISEVGVHNSGKNSSARDER